MFPARGFGVLSLFIAFVVVCFLSIVAHSAVDDDDLAGFPERPNIFRSPEELKEYLRALNEYFAIAGRPRFGRSVDRLHASLHKASKLQDK